MFNSTLLTSTEQICISHVATLQTGLRLVPGCLQMLQNSYKPLETDTAIQPHLIDAVATFLKLAKTALLSKE